MNKITLRALLLASTIILAACSTDSIDEQLSRAQRSIAVGEYDAAALDLKTVLQQNNKLAEARWLLGRVYLSTGDTVSAEKELQRALELGWSKSDVLPALGESLVNQGKYPETLKLEETDLPPEVESKLLAIKALAAMGLGKSSNAKRLVKKALAIDPQSPEAMLANARILVDHGNLRGADSALDKLLELDKNDEAAWTLVGDLRLAQKRNQEALVAFNRAIEIKPDHFHALFTRALLSLNSGDIEAAQRDADVLLDLAPNQPLPHYIQGLIHFQTQRYSETVTYLSTAQPVFTRFPLVLFILGSAQLMEGNLDQASVAAGRFHSIRPESVRGRKLLATIRLAQGQNTAVEKLLQPVLDVLPNEVDSLNLMANALLRSGKTDEAITMLAKVAELQPDSPAAQVRLGASMLEDGRGDEAAQYMETALTLNPEFQQAEILLVLNHLQKQDYDAAIKAAKAYRVRNLNSPTPLNLLGRAFLEAGKPEKAKEYFEQTLKLEVGERGANHNLAQIAIAAGDRDSARKYYATALDHHKDDLFTLTQLALMDDQDKNEKALVNHLERAIAAHPTALQPRLMLGGFHLKHGRPEKVSPLFVDLNEAQKQTPKVLELMAMVQFAQKDHLSAQDTLGQLVASTSDTATTHYLMAKAAAGSGDFERADQELRRSLELDENYIPAIATLAKISQTMGRTEEFEKQFKKLQSLNPGHPDVLLLMAESANREGDASRAASLAQQAHKIAPSSPTVLALGSYQNAAGATETALSLYRDWLAKYPDDMEVRLRLSSTLLKADKYEETKFQFLKVLEEDPENVAVLNNIAWLLRENESEKALVYARRANQLAPKSAAVLDTLAVVEFFNKDYPRAQRNIERALKLIPDEPSLLYHKAMIMAAQGNAVAAINTLQDLFATNPDFPELDHASALLISLKK